MKSLFHIAFFAFTTTIAAAAAQSKIHVAPLQTGTPKTCTPQKPVLQCAADAADDTTLKGGPHKVTVPAGTLVILELNEKLTTGTITPGKMVQMRVRTHVKEDGEIVIRTGAQAIGRVKSITAGTYNSPEEITVELYYVLSVDGQQLPLFGNEQTFAADQAPAPGGVPINSVFTAQLMNNEEVEVH